MNNAIIIQISTIICRRRSVELWPLLRKNSVFSAPMFDPCLNKFYANYATYSALSHYETEILFLASFESAIIRFNCLFNNLLF